VPARARSAAQRASWSSAAVALLAVVPAAVMLVEVAGAPRMNALDYWDVLARVTGDAGEFTVRGALSLQNEHPTLLPGLAYYADARWFGADNRALGLLTWLMAAASLALLVRLLPRSLPPASRGAAVVLLAWLVFAPKGLHNFVYGMSGTAWWSANLAVLAALTLWHRGRRGPACAAGLVACACYGTGFAVWPALLVLALLRREGRWMPVPFALGLVTVTAWTVLGGSDSGGRQLSDPSALETVGTALTTTGSLFSSGPVEVAGLAGAITVVALLLALAALAPAWAGRSAAEAPGAPPAETAPWVALAVWGVASLWLIATARTHLGTEALAGRYTSIAALFLAATVVLTLSARVRAGFPAVPAAVAVLVLATVAAAAGTTTAVRGHYRTLELHAVAVRLGVPATVPAAGFDSTVLPTLQALRGYPFTAAFDLGCGRREGDVVDVQALPRLPLVDRFQEQTGGRVDSVVEGPAVDDDADVRGQGVRVEGWALLGREPAGCVLVTTPDGEVVGGGIVGIPREDLAGPLGWAVVVPGGSPRYTVVLVAGDDPHSDPAYRVPIDLGALEPEDDEVEPEPQPEPEFELDGEGG
jgi:hypothetical protein